MRQTWWAREASWGRGFERTAEFIEESASSVGASSVSAEVEKGRLHISQISDWVDSSSVGSMAVSETVDLVDRDSLDPRDCSRCGCCLGRTRLRYRLLIDCPVLVVNVEEVEEAAVEDGTNLTRFRLIPAPKTR